jgi:hypothetical protein
MFRCLIRKLVVSCNQRSDQNVENILQMEMNTTFQMNDLPANVASGTSTSVPFFTS